ncbi:MAG: tRNA lysidine(34) synthetase TilS [Anaerolineaceae bacterium]|nr:tRNA lysidine(34) synthetase TilS [Anaerolineaceae bacterium]
MIKLDELKRTLHQDCGLDTRQPSVVGVSGGADSLCLMDAMDKLGYPLVVGHLDHQLRPESAADAALVEAAAGAKGLPFVGAAEDVAGYARQHRLSIEEAARVVRYRFLFEQARRCNAQAVGVGHTADDQVETVLMHLLRGAGLSGLKGMNYRSLMPVWDEYIPLVRPLLGVWRMETVAYCEQQRLNPVFDHTNLDTTLFRNRLRLELIPYLEQFNPRLKEVMWRMAQALTGDHAMLETLGNSAWNSCRVDEGLGYVILSQREALRCVPGVQRSVVRSALGRLRPHLRDIGFETVERAVRFIHQPTRSRQCDLIGGITLTLDQDRLIFSAPGTEVLSSELPQMVAGEEWELPVPGELVLKNGWRLVSETLQADSASLHFGAETAGSHAWLDESTVSLPLQVRTRKPGDRFEPLGMDGHSLKLSDFLINERSPRSGRDGLPLVCSQDKIIWVPGYRQAHTVRVTPSTKRVVHLRLERT